MHVQKHNVLKMTAQAQPKKQDTCISIHNYIFVGSVIVDMQFILLPVANCMQTMKLKYCDPSAFITGSKVILNSTQSHSKEGIEFSKIPKS